MTEPTYIARVTDFETTGIPDDENKHSVVEAAFVDVMMGSKQIAEHRTYQTLVYPETEMDIQAQATHHIDAMDAKRAGVGWLEAETALLKRDTDESIVYVAHNADFEKKFFNPSDSKWVDTYKVALKLYPDAPSHSNQVLKYYLEIRNDDKHHPPHRALPDCYVTAAILIKMSEKMSFNEMIKVSREPAYLTKITFGKHKGLRYDEAPKGYLQWILNQSDMDEAVKAAARRCIAGDGNE